MQSSDKRKRSRERSNEEVTSSLAKRVKREKKDEDEDESTLPPLKKCVLCTTGFDAEQRERTAKMARECGASIKGDLTKKTTHLIVLTNNAPSKSKKYEFAVRWGVHVVPLSWLEACHNTQTRLPESDYPVNPPDELASTQLSAEKPPKKAPQSRPRQETSSTVNAIAQTMVNKRQVLGDCICGVLGTSSESMACAESVIRLGGRGFTVGERDFPREMTHLIVTGSVSDVNMTSSAISAAHKTCKRFVAAVKQEWVAACVAENKRVSEEHFKIEIDKMQSNEMSVESGESRNENESGSGSDSATQQKEMLFSGCVFSSLGFNDDNCDDSGGNNNNDDDDDDSRSEKANEAWVRACGGDYVSLTNNRSGKRITHLIVAHGVRKSVIDECRFNCNNMLAGNASAAIVVVSQQWVEACRTVGMMLDPNCCPVLKPLPQKLPYPSMKGVTICFTGLPIQKLFLYALLARDIGATVTNNFYVKQTTHLVCGKFEGAKYDRAIEAGVPIVGLEWLESCAREGVIQDYTSYIHLNNHMATNSNAINNGSNTNISNVLCDVFIHIYSAFNASERVTPAVLEARRCAVRMGAQIAEKACFGVTHCIHVIDSNGGGGGGNGSSNGNSGKMAMLDYDAMDEEMRNCIQEEAEETESVGAFFVSSEWLSECERNGERVSETPFIIQNPLQHSIVVSQKTNNNNNNNNNQINSYNNNNNKYLQQQQQISPQKALSSPLGVIGLRNQDNTNTNGGGGGGIFFQTQPQRTYSRKGSGGKKNTMNFQPPFDSPGNLFNQNESLLNELSNNGNGNGNIQYQHQQRQQSNLQQQFQLSPQLTDNNNDNNSNEINDNNNESNKKDEDAVLLECLSGLRGLQSKESNNIANENSNEALPITRSGNKHNRHRHHRHNNSNRGSSSNNGSSNNGNSDNSNKSIKAHRTRLLVDPFSDETSKNGSSSGGGGGGGGNNNLLGFNQNHMMMTSFGDSDVSCNNNGNDDNYENAGNESGNESEELFDNPSQIIAYAPDADQRKREDLRRRLQNAK